MHSITDRIIPNASRELRMTAERKSENKNKRPQLQTAENGTLVATFRDSSVHTSAPNACIKLL